MINDTEGNLDWGDPIEVRITSSFRTARFLQNTGYQFMFVYRYNHAVRGWYLCGIEIDQKQRILPPWTPYVLDKMVKRIAKRL